MIKDIFDYVISLLKSRLFPLIMVFVLIVVVLINRLFSLQIIKGASYVTLIASTATGFLGYDQMPLTDRKQVAKKAMQQVMDAGTDVSELQKEHIEDYQALFNRQDFSLHTSRSGKTDKLLKDPAAFQAVCELLYYYGKYLMISGSRRGGQPLNLQGQWNADIRPAWSSNYTVNINTEMNY